MQETAGSLLRKTREARGLTLKDVTMATGMDGSLLSRWERGEVTDVTIYVLLPLVRFLDLDLYTIADMLIKEEDAKRGAVR